MRHRLVYHRFWVPRAIEQDLAKPLRHKEAIAHFKADAIVEGLGLGIVAIDFKMECFDVELMAGFFEEVERLCADALIAIVWSVHR